MVPITVDQVDPILSPPKVAALRAAQMQVAHDHTSEKHPVVVVVWSEAAVAGYADNQRMRSTMAQTGQTLLPAI